MYDQVTDNFTNLSANLQSKFGHKLWSMNLAKEKKFYRIVPLKSYY